MVNIIIDNSVARFYFYLTRTLLSSYIIEGIDDDDASSMPLRKRQFRKGCGDAIAPPHPPVDRRALGLSFEPSDGVGEHKIAAYDPGDCHGQQFLMQKRGEGQNSQIASLGKRP